MDVHGTLSEPDLQYNAEKHGPSSQIILSIDDGGMRGLATLTILQTLMNYVHNKEEEETGVRFPIYSQRPCDYFDYVVGVGSGGLIALMLGRMRMTLAECHRHFRDLTVGIFQQPKNYTLPTLHSKRQQDTATLERKLQALTTQRARELGEMADMPLADARKTGCKTAVAIQPAVVAGWRQQEILLRSYDGTQLADSITTERVHEAADTVPVWQVARASLSRPNYFPPYEIKGKRIVDAGDGHRSPLFPLIWDLGDLPNNEWSIVGCVVSVAGGRPFEKQPVYSERKRDKALVIGSVLVDYATRSRQEKRNTWEQIDAPEATTYARRAFETRIGDNKAYFRLDFKTDFWDYSLDDVEQGKLEDVVEGLPQDEMAQAQLHECARILVARRRAREQSSQDE